MASIHRDSKGRSPNWFCAFRLPDGRRTLKSTGTADRKEALKICRGFERASQIAARPDVTRDRLVRVFDELLESLGYEKISSVTVKQWFTGWLLAQKGTVSEGTHAKYSQIINNFVELLGARADVRLESISTDDVTRFRDKLLSQGLVPKTINLTLAVVKSAFKQAVNEGHLLRNPVAPIRAQKEAKSDEGRGTFSPEQVAKLVQAAEGDWRGLILFGYYSGARLTDLSRLNWSNIDLAEKTIVFRQQTTGKKITIPIHPAIETYLLSLPSSDAPNSPLFPSLNGKLPGGMQGLSTAFRKIMTRAGINPATVREGKGSLGRSLSALSFHSLRHSFNQELLRAGVPQEFRMQLTGHSSQKMNAIYSHEHLEGLYAHVAKVPTLPKVEGGLQS
jgi:integrase